MYSYNIDFSFDFVKKYFDQKPISALNFWKRIDGYTERRADVPKIQNWVIESTVKTATVTFKYLQDSTVKIW